MRANSPIIHSHPRLFKSNSNSNITHIHILCPYKFCNCFCTICNSYSVCSCICHSNNQKSKVNSLSLSKDINHSEKANLSNEANNIYQKTRKYLHCNYESSLSQSNDIKNASNLNLDQLTKKIFYDKLYKTNANNSGRCMSEINLKRNNYSNIRKQCLYLKEKYLNKSNMTNFNSNNSNYNYNYDNKKMFSFGNPLTDRENNSYSKNLNKNKEEETNNNIEDKTDDKISKYLNINYEKDLENNNNNRDKDEKSNYQYLSNYFRKRCKNKSSLNSPHKSKIKEIIIQSRINKNKYTTFDLNKNISKDNNGKLIKNKNRKTYYNNENKDISNNSNKTHEYDKLIYNNFITKKDRINYDKQINRNRNQLSILNKKKNKTSYAKLNYNTNNIKKNPNIDISKIKKGNSNRESKDNHLKKSSFSFSFINRSINKNIIEKLKKELLWKNQEAIEYKNKYIVLQKELEFYKSENKKLKQMNINYINKNNNQKDRNMNFKNKYSDEMFKIINKENNYNFDYNNINEKQSELSSKLKLKTDLNIDNENYFQTFCNNILSEKCIFAISSLTKSKSILCFDYANKSFSFRDYADFGDFQENYYKSLENNKDNQKNNSIFLTIDYNFYIITGENFDSFYVFNALKRTINKLCSLKNNHSNGSMLNYNGDIICISGNYNKKVELFNEAKNEWIDLPELQIERSDFASVIFRNKYIFCLFGYNLPTKQYLNSIEYLDIENYNKSTWNYLKYKNENLLSLYFKCSLGINYNNEKIIIVGGNEGQENFPNDYFYQLIISKNFENNKNSYIEKTKRKPKDINKYKCYSFNKGNKIFLDKDNLYCMAFDDDLRAHIFNINNMAHDIFFFDS